MSESAQEEFDRLYISSSEITESLGIARSTLLNARRQNWIPAPITIGPLERPYITLWRRADVQEFLGNWSAVLKRRRGEE